MSKFGLATVEIDTIKWSTPTIYHETLDDGLTFNFQIWTIGNSIEEGDVIASTSPWLLPFHIKLGEVSDKLEPNRIYTMLKGHGVECAAVVRAGTITQTNPDRSKLEIDRRKEFHLYFPDEVNRSAAQLLI